MKNILIVPNQTKDTSLSVSREVLDFLASHGATVYFENKYLAALPDNAKRFKNGESEIELVIVIGGDGSMLDASKIAIENNVPIVGVNLGKVGYLSEVEQDNVAIFARLFTGEYAVDERMLLSVEHISGGVSTKSERLAVNDVIISHDTFLGIADFAICRCGGETVNYRADGIILSTPVGSTAYSLSAGGPVLAHEIDCILATPIAPHSFFNRSIIFPRSEVLEVRNRCNTQLKVSVDGRLFMALEEGELCRVKASERSLKVLSFKQNNMFETLFGKMKILEDVK